MGKKDSLSKEIDGISREIKFYQNIFLAVMSGVVGVVYAFAISKIPQYSLYFAILGGCVVVFATIRIKILHKKGQKLIDILEGVE